MDKLKRPFRALVFMALSPIAFLLAMVFAVALVILAVIIDAGEKKMRTRRCLNG